MKAMLVVLVLCVCAVSASAATMTPMSDSSLSGISAGHHTDTLLVETFITDQGQQNVNALNLINAGGPVQVGGNIMVVAGPEFAGLKDSHVIQAVVNLQHQECSPCEFDDATLQTGVSNHGQENACALNLINTAGAVNVGTNLLAVVSCNGAAVVKDSCVVQVVLNGACQTTPFEMPQ